MCNDASIGNVCLNLKQNQAPIFLTLKVENIRQYLWECRNVC